jgi:hypothetical protein
MAGQRVHNLRSCQLEILRQLDNRHSSYPRLHHFMAAAGMVCPIGLSPALDMSPSSTPLTHAPFNTSPHTDKHSHTLSHLHPDDPFAHEVRPRPGTDQRQFSIFDSEILTTYSTAFSASGSDPSFHLIEKNAHPHVPTVAAGVTTVTHTRTPLDTDLTAPPDTSLLPALVTLAGRRHTLPCSWKGQRYDQFSMFSNTRQSGPPWATASSICRAPQSVRVSVDQVIMLTGTAQSRRLRVTREPRLPP